MFIYYLFGWKRLMSLQTGIVLQILSQQWLLCISSFLFIYEIFSLSRKSFTFQWCGEMSLVLPVSEICCPGISGTHFHTLDKDFLSFNMITLGLDCFWNLLNLNILSSGSVFAVKRFPLRQYVYVTIFIIHVLEFKGFRPWSCKVGSWWTFSFCF